MFSYDQVPYQSAPFAQSHPDRLAVIATLFGMSPQPIDQCRVLELGCAAGGNLIPMAEMFPNSLFLGVDLSQRQLCEGQALITRLNLENIELMHCNILDVSPELGKFHYIIVHGVYSWVPSEVQQKILRICHDQLEPNGVAYISYNTYPGWRMRGMIRDMLTYHTRQFEEPQERVNQSRALLEFLAESVNNDKAYGAFLAEELESFTKLKDYYLFHEHLEDINQPTYFHEFVELAESYDLQFLGEAEFQAMAYWNFSSETNQALQALSEDLIQIEQYMDFLRNRTFRQSLLCHRDHVLERTLSAKSMENLYVSSPLKPEQTDDEIDIASQDGMCFSQGDIQVTATSPLIKAAHKALYRAWPASIDFKALLRQATQDAMGLIPAGDSNELDDHFHHLGEHLIRCYASGAIELHSCSQQFVTIVSEQPAVSSLVRAQAEISTVVTNRRHEYVGLDKISRHVVLCLDGKQNREDILQKLLQLIEQGEISLEEVDSVEEIFEHALNQLCDFALLVK